MIDEGSHGSDGGGGSRKGRGNAEERRHDPRDLARLHDQLPPHAYEAEMSVLGSMLFDPRVTGDVIQILKDGTAFFSEGNGRIYDVMVELYDRHNALDIVQLNQVLADRGVLDLVGGVEYLVELAQSVPSAANAARYARIVAEKSTLRRLIDTAGEILHDAHFCGAGGEASRDVLEQAEQKIYRIASQQEQTQAEAIQDIVVEVVQSIEEATGRLVTGVPSGYHDLDEMTHGLQRGEMIILAARPSMGKTAFALNVAEQMALLGHGVGVFSLEMSKHALVQRLLSSRSGVDSQKIRRGMLGPEEWDRLNRACEELYESPLFIDDTPGLSLMQMRAKARRLKSKHDVQCFVIDYLQLMSSGRRAESRQNEIGEISRGVKAMARELNVPVICLSQLNRAAEQREGHRPRMSDLRESGSIEQDADVVAMLHREEYYHQADPDWKLHNEDKVGLAELIIAKQRNGPTGVVKLTWSGATTRFSSWSGLAAPDEYHSGGHSSGHSGAPAGGYAEPAPPRGGGYAPAPAAEVESEPVSAGFAPRTAFSAKTASGPVSDFRDGGEPDRGSVDGIPL
ncbi:MAG: replicative DNA helicase [Phycisphaerales bacterium]